MFSLLKRRCSVRFDVRPVTKRNWRTVSCPSPRKLAPAIRCSAHVDPGPTRFQGPIWAPSLLGESRSAAGIDLVTFMLHALWFICTPSWLCRQRLTLLVCTRRTRRLASRTLTTCACIEVCCFVSRASEASLICRQGSRGRQSPSQNGHDQIFKATSREASTRGSYRRATRAHRHCKIKPTMRKHSVKGTNKRHSQSAAADLHMPRSPESKASRESAAAAPLPRRGRSEEGRKEGRNG